MDVLRSAPKVFGIGFHKTGTTSLKQALVELGYRVTGPNYVRDEDIGEKYVDLTIKLSAQYDAFQDNPWPLVYREMDSLYPDARFVLTWREPEKWIASQVAYFGMRATPMREAIYGKGRGYPLGNEKLYIETYNAHNVTVRSYFRDRPGKLLVMNLEDGDGWKELCSFLGHEAPLSPFPHAKRRG